MSLAAKFLLFKMSESGLSEDRKSALGLLHKYEILGNMDFVKKSKILAKGLRKSYHTAQLVQTHF